MKVFLNNDFTIDNIDTEEVTQDSVGYNILKVYVPESVVEATDTFAVSYAALLPSSRKVGAFGMVYSSTDPAIETGYALFKATLHQSVVSYPGKVAISFQFVYGTDGNATLIKKNSAIIQFDVRKSVAVNNDILILDADQTTTDVLESYKDLLETALNTYLTQANAESTYAKLADSSQTITASKIKSGSVQYNTAYPSNDTDIKTNWFYGSSTNETYIHKDVYLPRRGDGQWHGRYGNGYRSYVQFNEDTRGNSSDNTTGFGVGLNGGRNSNIKPDVQLIPAFRYDSSYLANGYAELPDDPIVLFRPGFAFTTKGHINPLDNPNTWFGFETDSNDDTKKSVKIKTAEASFEVDSEGVKANDSLVVTQADIVDNLITNDATKVLSAKQGTSLKSSVVILDSLKASKNGSSTEDFSAKKLTVYGDTNTIGVDGAVIIQSTGGTSSYGNKAYFRAQSSSNQNYLTEYNEGSIYRRAQTGPSTSSGYTYTFPNKSGTFAMTSDVSALETKVNNLSSVQNAVDVVATKSALDALTTTNFEQFDKVQVIADETHGGASTVYEWTGSAWHYVGAYGGNTYTKTQTDALLATKQALIDSSHKLSSDLVSDSGNDNLFVKEVVIRRTINVSLENFLANPSTFSGTLTEANLAKLVSNGGVVDLELYSSVDTMTYKFIMRASTGNIEIAMDTVHYQYNYESLWILADDGLYGIINCHFDVLQSGSWEINFAYNVLYTKDAVDEKFLTDAQMETLISEVY